MAPIHSPTSRALASEVLRPTMRSGVSSWLLMKRMRDVIICGAVKHSSLWHIMHQQTQRSSGTLSGVCSPIHNISFPCECS